MSEKASDSEERLNSHPILKERFELLPDIIEDTGGDYDKADKAEPKFTEELRKTGNELMNSWALRQENIRAEAVKNRADTICHGKYYASDISISIRNRTDYMIYRKK